MWSLTSHLAVRVRVELTDLVGQFAQQPTQVRSAEGRFVSTPLIVLAFVGVLLELGITETKSDPVVPWNLSHLQMQAVRNCLQRGQT